MNHGKTNTLLFEPADLMALFQRYKRVIFVNAGFFSAVFLVAAFLLPHKYKSVATISIYTKYFQNPLVKDFLPDLYDTTELKAQRENLIRQALSEDFLNALGEKHGLFKSERGSQKRGIEMDELLKRVEVNSLQSTAFTVGYVGAKRQQTFDVTNDVLVQVTQTLAQVRRETITRIRDSVQRRVEAISLNSGGASPSPLAGGRPEVLRRELAKIQEQISALSMQYTPQHPRVKQLQSRADLIKRWLGSGASTPAGRSERPILMEGQPKVVSGEVLEDLLKKLNYLNILLDMEDGETNDYVAVLQEPTVPTSPIWPKKLVFLFWGIATGLMLSSIVILGNEYLERSAPSVKDFAREIEVPYLGQLPHLSWQKYSHSPNQAPKGEGPQTREWN